MLLEDEFWSFAASVYGCSGVAEILLELQDRTGANVNLALLCIWAAERGRQLSRAEISAGEAAIAGWQASSVEPLRALRKRLKGEWTWLAIDTEPTRQAVLTAELAAERATQALLLRALSPWPDETKPPPGLTLANLQTYLTPADAKALLGATGLKG